MKYYLIYRNRVPYGWTFSKSILKSFLKQRNKKYQFVKVDKGDLEKIFNADGTLSSSMINEVQLKSVSTGTNFNLFLTLEELRNDEKLIQRLVRDEAKFVKVTSKYEKLLELVHMFTHLRNDYAAALYFLGYRPPEIESLMDTSDEIAEVDEIIDYAYEESWLPPNLYNSILPGEASKLPSFNLLTDYYTKVIYSLESFIKVLRDDLRRK